MAVKERYFLPRKTFGKEQKNWVSRSPVIMQVKS